MPNNRTFLSSLVCFTTLLFISAVSAEQEPARIDEKIGDHIPLELTFNDETGNVVKLEDLITGPTLLSLVYFTCPSICTPLLNGLKEGLEGLEMKPVEEFKVLTISFEPTEGSQLASGKKENYLGSMERKLDPMAWRFLTGDSANINKLLKSTGFYIQRLENEIAHGTAVIAISPTGKITRYLHGIEFLPFDLKMALIEAEQEKPGISIKKIAKLCFSYDPEGRTYILNITRIVGAVMVLVLLIFLLTLIFIKRTKVS